ncbi:MAG: hypothetical protein AAF589_07270, partial [Planctomycetota bacterium]
VVTHNLYQPQELEKVRRDHAGGAAAAPAQPAAATPAAAPAPAASPAPAPAVSPATGDWRSELTALRAEMQEEIEMLRGEIESLRQQFGG